MNGKTVVILVENLPVPFDRRVWQEAKALRDAGWRVRVICPTSATYSARLERLDGIDIYRHPLPVEGRGAAGFLIEYAAAHFHQLRLLLQIRARGPIDVIQACNPPDTMVFVALPFKLFGTRFVFDHHDLCPELYDLKFAARGLLYSLLAWCERVTFKYADLVISSNHTLREIAIERGGKAPADVVAVYSVPDRDRLRRVAADPALKRGCGLLVGYVGIIGDQDGLDHLVEAVAYIREQLGFRDFHTIVVGDGTALASVRALAHRLGQDDAITFTGYLTGEALLTHLSSFDIGVIPDPVNAFNDKMSMNKVFEYSAFGVPTVAYPLTETIRLLGDAGTFAKGSEPADLGRAILTLMQDPATAARQAAAALDLATSTFSWENESKTFVAAYARFLPPRSDT